MTTVVIVQARLGSARLPGKVFLCLAGEPVLGRVISRVSRAHTADAVVVATTVAPLDDLIASFCDRSGIDVFRGSENDVLDRYYRAASQYGADLVVRITSDCPFVDPMLIDQCVETIQTQGADYASNVVPRRSFPQGLDVEVFTFDALQEAWSSDQNPIWREHVTQYLVNHPEKFMIRCVENNQDLSMWRWTLDTIDDFHLIATIYDCFPSDSFSWRDIASFCTEHPELARLNRHVRQKTVPL